MPEDEIKKAEGAEMPPEPAKRRRTLSRRNLLLAAGIAAAAAIALVLVSTIAYRIGAFDTYIKAQFVEKLSYMGLEFEADVFRVTVSPLELELRNAVFTDRETGEKLFFVREARLGLTILDLFSWQLSREIRVDTTDVSGAEVWVLFDDQGRSNFANLIEDMRPSNLEFNYSSTTVNVRDSTVHFGDMSRRISGVANNVQFTLVPEVQADVEKRYKIDLTSTKSRFVYDESVLDEISVRARVLVDPNGADITELRIETPIGVSYLTGRIEDWAEFVYRLEIESTVDLTSATSIFPVGAAIRGIGNFKGTVSGKGEKYKIDGKIDSESISAEGIYLKAFNVAATVEGTNANYEANGNAVAELLTFGDFRVDFPRITGNVRGTGTDFRWLGELQAAAARSGSLSLGGLFLSDAVAEYRDRQFSASAGNGRAQKFSAADVEFAAVSARNIRFALRNGETGITATSVNASRMTAKDYSLSGIEGRNLSVKSSSGQTEVNISGVSSNEASVRGSKARGVTASDLRLVDRPGSTDIDIKNMRADRFDLNGTRVDGIESPEVRVRDTDRETIVYSDRLRVARIDGGGAMLGSLNIAGLRLTIRQGRLEARSEDIDAGTVTLAKSAAIEEGGTLENVTIASPVYVLEPSGRYRATADMSLGGGMLGSIPLGAATAKVDIDNQRAEFSGLKAEVMNGRIDGYAAIANKGETRSEVSLDFSGIDLSKLLALQTTRFVPFEGKTNGKVDITFPGTEYKSSSGTVSAKIAAAPGRDDSGRIQVGGDIQLTATDGRFDIDRGVLSTDNSELASRGWFDLRQEDSNLTVDLRSTDADEIDRLVRVLGVAPELERYLDSLQVRVSGDLAFRGDITGDLSDPTVDGRGSISLLSLRGQPIGSIESNVRIAPLISEFRNGLLREVAGGSVTFDVTVPAGEDNTTVDAKLSGVNVANLIALLPFDLPGRLRDLTGRTSGNVALVGLPNKAKGEIDFTSTNGTLAGESFENLRAKLGFDGTRIDIKTAEIRIGEGVASVSGTYDWESTAFDLRPEGKRVPVSLALSFIPKNDFIQSVGGYADFKAAIIGETRRTETFRISFDGNARDVSVNDNPFGAVDFAGKTNDRGLLSASLTAVLENRPQVFDAELNFADPDLPFAVRHNLSDQSPLGPFFAFVPQLRPFRITGTGSGIVEFGGNLMPASSDGSRAFSTQNLSGKAEFSQLALQIQDSPLVATEPVIIRFSTSEVTFVSARFAGGGSNVTVSGTKAISETSINNLAIEGRINLALLNVFPVVAATDVFFGGFADVKVQLAGVNRTARLSGRATVQNGAVAMFIGSDRLSFSRIKTGIIFTANAAQFENLEGYLGGGAFTGSGGIIFGENLRISSYRATVTGTNITVPLPEGFITTGDARLEFTGRQRGTELENLIAGSILARRSYYGRDIDLANIMGARREVALTGGGSASPVTTRFDISIEGRDALVVRNNIADLTASVSLRLTGTTEDPQLSGRISATGGTVLFRKDRYSIQRGVLEFPPNTAVDPIINLLAEAEIKGYQVFVNLSGSLSDTELLNATVRSNPALPQADVISLITTGNLANTESGIPTFASTGINTAAEILADTIINNPARRATDRLFGLNVFEIDPIIAGQQLNPSARLTVGRQINNNLRVTYATNLSQNQNQVLALEYRVSNKLSFIAQYEQRSLSNVTANRDNFSFEIRFRRRF
jgi:translocation and assembly module TamB